MYTCIYQIDNHCASDVQAHPLGLARPDVPGLELCRESAPRHAAAQAIPIGLQARAPVGSTGRCGILLIALPSVFPQGRDRRSSGGSSRDRHLTEVPAKAQGRVSGDRPLSGDDLRDPVCQYVKRADAVLPLAISVLNPLCGGSCKATPTNNRLVNHALQNEPNFCVATLLACPLRQFTPW